MSKQRTLPIGMAIVGAGYWGPNVLRVALATPGIRVKWLCDLDEARARQVLGSYTAVRPTCCYEKILADPSVSAVVVTTPAATHFDLVRAALEAGKHVLVEKPLAMSAADGHKLVELARQSGLTLMCDHTYCYTPVVQQIRNLVHAGEIGEIRFVDSIRVNLGIVQSDVDVLWDLAPHDLSILDFVLPGHLTAVAVAAHASDPVGAGRACLAHLSVWLSSGALVHCHVNWLSPTKVRTMVIGGSRRTVVWDDMNPPARLAIHDHGMDSVPLESLEPEERRRVLNSWRTGDIRVPALTEREALTGMMSEFASAITEKRAPLTDGPAAVRVLVQLEAASRSAELGGERVALSGLAAQ
jgi:predicted dehydrogenase